MLWLKEPRQIFKVVWVFAYGSLIFRPGFSFLRQIPGSVDGFARRFWQGSPDHRGTAKRPGRVVTLVSAPHEVCEGVAFEVCQESTDEVLRYLDERESGGYERLKVNVTLEGGERVQAWTWMAPPDNSNYLGDASQDVMLAQILGSTGASGANRDYVMNLAGELQRLGIEDIHVQNLARLVREASAD